MSSPALTLELKSTRTSRRVPEIWLPTSMERTGLREPLAVTCWVTSPLEMVTVRYSMVELAVLRLENQRHP